VPTENEVNDIRRSGVDYTSDIMDAIGQLFAYDRLCPAWNTLQTSLPAPPRFVGIEELNDLKMGIWERIEELYPVRLKDMPQASSLLFFLRFSHSFPGASTPVDKEYWATIQLSENTSSLDIFVRESDRHLFTDDGLAHLNATLQILYGASQYPPRTYSLQEINWNDDPLTKVDCVSGAVNAMFLMSIIYPEKSSQIRDLVKHQGAQAILDGLHEFLIRLSRRRKIDNETEEIIPYK